MPEKDVKNLRERLCYNIHWVNEEDTIEQIIDIVKDWLEDKKLKRLATEAYLKPKAETDIIHRHMYFMNGSELDMLNELIKECI